MPELTKGDRSLQGRESVRKRAVVLARRYRNAEAGVTNTEVAYHLGEQPEEAMTKARQARDKAREYLCLYLDAKSLAWSVFDPRGEDAKEALFDEEWDIAADAMIGKAAATRDATYMAVQDVRAGMTQTAAAEKHGVTQGAVSKRYARSKEHA